jgi:hypothetical protein
MTIDREFLCVLLKTYEAIKNKRDSTPDCHFYFNFKDYRNYWFSHSQSSVRVSLLARGFSNLITNTMQERHMCWLVEGDTFYATFEMTLVGVLFKYYLKRNHTIEDACAGMIGFSDKIHLNRSYSTPLTFCQLMAAADQLKNTFNKQRYRYMRNDCRDFVIEFGKLIAPNFDIKTPNGAYFPEKFSIHLSNKRITVDANEAKSFPFTGQQSLSYASCSAMNWQNGTLTHSQAELYNKSSKKKKKSRAPLYNLDCNQSHAPLYSGLYYPPNQ